MKSYLLLFLLITTASFAQQNPENYKSDIELGSGFALTTFLTVKQDGDELKITSPRGADRRLFGVFKSTLGRITGNAPKKGSFVRIEANQVGDSLFGVAKAPMLGTMDFVGVLKANSLSGNLIKNDTSIIGSISGVVSDEKSLDYAEFYPKILQITQNNIFSKEALETKEWRKFQKKLKKVCNKAEDDIEFYLGFSIYSNQLPFSHYSLMLNEESNSEEEADTMEKPEPTVIFEGKGNNTGYLQIKNFSTSQEELAAILPKIVENEKIQNLIVDLRDNGGGGVEAAFEFAKYISRDSITVGYFVTNKFEHSGFDKDLFEKLPAARPQTTEEFIEELKSGEGAKLVFAKPANEVFTGKLYILTNANTASTCEPLVYVLKENKQATIIGETTAGAMLSASYFDISGKYKLVLPLADFYTYDGIRLEGVGVKPDVETTSGEALNKAMEMIGESTD